MGCKESNQTNKKSMYFFQTPHIIHMTKSQSVSRILKRSLPLPPSPFPPPPSPSPFPQFIVFLANKTALKYIADPITNQIIQCTSIACEGSITKS